MLMRNWAARLASFDDPRRSFRSVWFCTSHMSLKLLKVQVAQKDMLHGLRPFSARAIP